MKLDFYHKQKKLSLDIKEVSFLGRFIGLMFKSLNKSRALLFDFDKESRIAIHSLFVFFPFAVLWLDKDNKIIESKIVEPWKLYVCPKKSFYRLIEIPLKKDYKEILDFVVEGEKFKY